MTTVEQLREEGERKVDAREGEFVERFVIDRARDYPEAFRICSSCHAKPPCMHYAVGLSTLWQMGRDVWAARPLDHARVDAVGRDVPRRRAR